MIKFIRDGINIPKKSRRFAFMAIAVAMSCLSLSLLFSVKELSFKFSDYNPYSYLKNDRSSKFKLILLTGADLAPVISSEIKNFASLQNFDISVQPSFSRSLASHPILYPKNNIYIILLPNEQLSEKYCSQFPAESGVIAKLGPPVYSMGLSLLMSKGTYTHFQKRQSSLPRTLAGWINLCASEANKNNPCYFYMPDPNTSSSSWMGLAELVKEETAPSAVETDSPGTTRYQQILSPYKSKINVRGISARIESFKFALDDDYSRGVLLLYDHLASSLVEGKIRSDLIKINLDCLVKNVVTPIIEYDQSRFTHSKDIAIDSIIKILQDNYSTFQKPNSQSDIKPPYSNLKKMLSAWNTDSGN